MSDDPTEQDSALIDLSGVGLRDLDEISESSLARVLSAILDSNEGDLEPVAGFNSRI